MAPETGTLSSLRSVAPAVAVKRELPRTLAVTSAAFNLLYVVVFMSSDQVRVVADEGR
jgi:hypothetical protein